MQALEYGNPWGGSQLPQAKRMPGILGPLREVIKFIDFRTSILFMIDKENRQKNDFMIGRWKRRRPPPCSARYEPRPA